MFRNMKCLLFEI